MGAKRKLRAGNWLAVGATLAAVIGMTACAQMPVPIPAPMPAATPALSGTWVGSTQVFVFCPGGKLAVWDPSKQTQWCLGTYAPDGQISANCNVNGRAHTSNGRCTMNGATMNCAYTAGNQPYSFNFTRGSGGVCKG